MFGHDVILQFTEEQIAPRGGGAVINLMQTYKLKVRMDEERVCGAQAWTKGRVVPNLRVKKVKGRS